MRKEGLSITTSIGSILSTIIILLSFYLLLSELKYIDKVFAYPANRETTSLKANVSSNSESSKKPNRKRGKRRENNEGGIIYQEAQRSTYDRRRKLWHLQGDVKVYYKDGVLFCDDMVIHTDDEWGIANGNVRLIRQDTLIKAGSVVLYYRTKYAMLYQVTGLRKGKYKDKRLKYPVRFQTPYLEYDLDADLAYTDKGIKFFYKDYTISADTFNWDGNQEIARFEGNVHAYRAEDEIRAMMCVVDLKNEIVDFQGNVKMKVYYTKEKERFYRREEQELESSQEEIYTPELTPARALDEMEAIRIKLKGEVLRERVLQDKSLKIRLPVGIYLKSLSYWRIYSSRVVPERGVAEDIHNITVKHLIDILSSLEPNLTSELILTDTELLENPKVILPFRNLEKFRVAIGPPLPYNLSSYQLGKYSIFESYEDYSKALLSLSEFIGSSCVIFINYEFMDRCILERVTPESIGDELFRDINASTENNPVILLTLSDVVKHSAQIKKLKPRVIIIYIDSAEELLRNRRLDFDFPEDIELAFVADYWGLKEFGNEKFRETFNYSSPELKSSFYRTVGWLAVKYNAQFILPLEDVLSNRTAPLPLSELVSKLENRESSELLNTLSLTFGFDIYGF